MQLDKQELTKKEYIKLSNRFNQILKEKRATTWRRVDKPFHDGWILTLGLRDDLLRSDRGSRILEIIKKYGTSYVTRDVARVKRLRANNSLANARSVFSYKQRYDVEICSVRSLNEEGYKTLPDNWKKFFTGIKEIIPPRWGMEGREEMHYFFNIPLYYLTVKTSKRMVTHVQDINPELLKEEAYIRAKLMPYWRSCGGYQSWDKYFDKRGERRASKASLQKQLQGIEQSEELFYAKYRL